MSSGIEVLARSGYAARGVVYLIVGFLAVMAAFGRSEVEGTQGALQYLLSQPFGAALVGAVAFGMAAFCVWRLVQAVRDTDGHGTSAKGLSVRAALVVAAVSYAAIATLAVSMAIGSRIARGGGDPTSGWLAAIHEVGLGWLLVYGVAALFAIVGLAHVVKAVCAGFEKRFRCPADVMRWLKPLARFGLAARGTVFLIIAGLIVSGGVSYNVVDHPGLSDALKALQNYSFGWIVLAAISLGLVAFGLYSIAEARYRHVSPD